MCKTWFIVYWCEPYFYNENGFLVRHKLFRDWEKAHNFMNKKQADTSFHCTYVELDIRSNGVFNIT